MLAIGERPNRSPWLTVTSKGEPIIRTAQTRIYLEATTAKALSDLTAVKLPVLIEAASAEARLKQNEESGALRIERGDAYVAFGMYEEALQDFDKAAEDAETRTEALLRSARVSTPSRR